MHHSSMFKSLKGHLQGVYLVHYSRKFSSMSQDVNVLFTSCDSFLRLVTHFVELAARMYQIYSLKMTLYWLKHVGVTYSLNQVVT
jgi:hypothetical protein